ncbi:hypothetical protein [Vitreoscilla stercoraria]|uniref:Uncharacterized protein n=1 Tax=Vitreoscilla stercoraria TaxID=61 RepID=A0ABY4EDE5_VITST|nr:hypothetical protein [Vitreoscilla stercoraria]UOO92955.1 hypothetical protein LVJ81_02635 [Vitreoscilla stercoraria]
MLCKQKVQIIFGLLLCACITVAGAQSPAGFVKKVYADHLNEDLLGIDTIKLHAAPQLRRLIEERDRIADAHEGEMCEWVYDAYPLIPGNDYDTRLNQMTFTPLANGRIKAKGRNFGQTFEIDFAVACSGDTCKIVNLYTPDDYRAKMAQIIRAGTC